MGRDSSLNRIEPSIAVVRRWMVRTRLDTDAVLLNRLSIETHPGRLLVLICLFAFISGAVTGSFGAFGGGNTGQIVYSAIKVPMLLLITFCLCLPSFLVVNSLLGLRSDLRIVLQALLVTQSGIAIVLAALSPCIAVWYASDGDYQRAILANVGTFAIASVVGQVVLRRCYRPMIAKNTRHQTMMRLWFFIYAAVGIQMGWVLRPFIGSPSAALHFFRQEPWSNAYIVVWRVLVRTLFG